MDHYCERRLESCEAKVGKELIEITPIVLGGSPTDPANKTLLTREQHFQAVRYWNQIIRDLRKQSSASRT
jgi:hypothetical protein